VEIRIRGLDGGPSTLLPKKTDLPCVPWLLRKKEEEEERGIGRAGVKEETILPMIYTRMVADRYSGGEVEAQRLGLQLLRDPFLGKGRTGGGVKSGSNLGNECLSTLRLKP
jgi:hypothetical protein